MGCKPYRIIKKFFQKEIRESLFKTKNQCGKSINNKEFYVNHVALKDIPKYTFVQNSLKTVNFIL